MHAASLEGVRAIEAMEMEAIYHLCKVINDKYGEGNNGVMRFVATCRVPRDYAK